MNIRNTTTKTSTTSLEKMVDQWTNILLICSILLILLLTLFPFHFFFKNPSIIDYRALVLAGLKSIPIEALANVLLFIPLGFGLTCLMQKRKLEGIVALIVIQALSSAFSLTIEVLQVFLPARLPSLIDLLTNSIGAFLGFLCFRLWGVKILSHASAIAEKSKGCLSLKKLTLAFIGYTTLTFLISIHFANATNFWNLSNWDQTFPLLLGNEATGDRPWRGHISELYIANRAISEEEVAQAFSEKGPFASIKDSLLASYRLTGRGRYSDQTGHLPDLSWKREPPDVQDERGVFLTPGHWLETDTSVAYMAQKLRETSQFTFSATVATADTKQTGPARIISISKDPSSRNFTIGQEGTDLVFRLRTPLTGVGGTKPEIIVSNIFTDTNPHRLLITYSKSFLQLYVDKLENLHSLEMTPEFTFIWYLSHSSGRIDINHYPTDFYKLLYYGFIFIPLGFILAITSTVLRGRFVFHILLILGGILLPSLILQIIFASVSEIGAKLENLLLSVFITGATLLLFKRQTASWFKS